MADFKYYFLLAVLVLAPRATDATAVVIGVAFTAAAAFCLWKGW